ncbi:hypothetical protein BV898_17744 [Hypsibius exemplaris]|uniref:Putative auto-transporter adhesin head GIN domain-containing protein n=1 Tax=Hypsibius exemplaris TaxID=2072580 RepID=A0A9X6NHG8_HYPEX|nr:hypothetical protein BV898_17744 [Hypsibius exemplaris]
MSAQQDVNFRHPFRSASHGCSKLNLGTLSALYHSPLFKRTFYKRDDQALHSHLFCLVGQHDGEADRLFHCLVSITINGQEGVTVHAPDAAILALVETVVVDGILVVRFKPTARSVKGVVFIAISAIRCSSIDTEGSCSVTVTPAVREDSIRLFSQGSSSIRLAVESSLVTANLQGSSTLDVSGSATTGSLRAGILAVQRAGSSSHHGAGDGAGF